MGSGLELLLEIKGDVTKLLLDIPDNFTFGGGVEGITALSQVLDQVFGEIATGKVKTEDGVRESETFVDWNSVGNAITRVQHDTSGTTGGVKGQDGLDSDVESGGIKGFKHDLGHLFTVSLGVERGLSEQDGMLFRSDTEFVVESVMPDLFHIIPVGDDTVFNGVLESENTTLRLSLVTELISSEGA